MLPTEAITEFKQIYLEEFGKELSLEEATEKATSVFNLFSVLLKPIDSRDKRSVK